MSILVIGLGELGTAMVEALFAHSSLGDRSVTVLLRPSAISTADPAKLQTQQRIRSLGASFVAGDVVHDSVADLAALFSKYHTLLSCGGLGLPSGTQIRIAEAVLQAGTPVYFPWQFGVDYDVIGEGSTQDLFDEQLTVRKMLRAQEATDWIIVSVGLFMSFLFLPAFGVVDIKERTVRALGSWETQVTVTTPEDISRMTAEVALRPEDLSHQVVHIAGDTVSYARVADLVEARFGGEWRREVWDLEHIAKELEKDSGNMMLKYRGVFGAGKGVWWDKKETLNVKRDIKLTGLEEYLEQMQ